MKNPIRILLQTTIPTTEDDWHIKRFSLLHEHLASLKDEAGNPLCEVTARDREVNGGGDDPVLSALDKSDTEKGCPSFVEEAPGDGYQREPHALRDIKTYVRNAALWLAATN
jgi:hypothetical protein